MKLLMKNDLTKSLDLQIEVVQTSIYYDIVKSLIIESCSISIIKVAIFSFIIKKSRRQKISIYNGSHSNDLVLKFLSQANGSFDDLCFQIPYIIQTIDLLVKNGLCEVHQGEIICLDLNAQIEIKFDSFTESALAECKTYSDRQFLREVISIV